MKLGPSILAVTFVVLTGALTTGKPRDLPLQIITFYMTDLCSFGCTDKQRAEYRRNLRFELHDLNGDRIPEFFVYVDHPDWCGNHFNCSYSVFKRRRNGYRQIAGGYPALRLTKRITNGYYDLESRHDIGICTLPNGSLGRDVFVNVLRYDGRQYKPTDLGEQCRPSVPVPAFRPA